MIRFGPGAPGIERAEVRLTAQAFEPHRHDTYAIGITTAGVQTFRYRGSKRVCLPGQLHILHPDELHDGAPGTEEGFAYRILYVAPELVHEALNGARLPFVADPVQAPTPRTAALSAALSAIDDALDDLGRADLASTIAEALATLSGARARAPQRVDRQAVRAVRGYLDAHACEQISAATLEQIAGMDRFKLGRHFRHALGTSPDRYRAMRRLSHARRLIQAGAPLLRAAAESGFADQSHMTRQFKRTYGLTPARWVKLTN